MVQRRNHPVSVLIVALPETAGSALYGMVDVLSVSGSLWEVMVGSGEERQLFTTRIVGRSTTPFSCKHGIPVTPDCSVHDNPFADVVILPEIWLRPEDSIKGRYDDLMEWLRVCYRRGASIYSACSGSILLAESGLLNGRDATSHWGYEELFRREYPKVKFHSTPNICFASAEGRIATAGGVMSWHDLAIHIIARHCGLGEAIHIAKTYLLRWHSEGQLPYTNLLSRRHHADTVVRTCERWLEKNFNSQGAVAAAVRASGIPERSLKRRFLAATETTLIEYVQRLRIESAKRQLETSDKSLDEISNEIGYRETAFFRRLFKRHTGLTPTEYRRMFAPYAAGVSPM
ncbi:GlxA family transcriptional regulator [Paraburkholderia solisilvae]|uniref:HTH-type transcriptional activator RhaR n=1 Tax=Paraburkholderia solisilvae TaxID=624376 RepID=A0A6J5DXS4_9BURK|nr:helix-turn-helix domain-containing protein [Paraburkholderia solisilvae]CAB3759070.1 HTH-type transcriptional activator RhaR [Paraburkholderia solisilvae]